MTYSYRDSSGQIGSTTYADHDQVQRTFAYSDRSGSIPSAQDRKPTQPATSMKGLSATFRNGLVQMH